MGGQRQMALYKGKSQDFWTFLSKASGCNCTTDQSIYVQKLNLFHLHTKIGNTLLHTHPIHRTIYVSLNLSLFTKCLELLLCC